MEWSRVLEGGSAVRVDSARSFKGRTVSYLARPLRKARGLVDCSLRVRPPAVPLARSSVFHYSSRHVSTTEPQVQALLQRPVRRVHESHGWVILSHIQKELQYLSRHPTLLPASRSQLVLSWSDNVPWTLFYTFSLTLNSLKRNKVKSKNENRQVVTIRIVCRYSRRGSFSNSTFLVRT